MKEVGLPNKEVYQFLDPVCGKWYELNTFPASTSNSCILKEIIMKGRIYFISELDLNLFNFSSLSFRLNFSSKAQRKSWQSEVKLSFRFLGGT